MKVVSQSRIQELYPYDERERLPIGWTPLMIASAAGELRVIARLLKHDDDLHTVNKVNVNGHTPLNLAISHGHDAAAKYLIRRGASVNPFPFCYHNRTALTIAAELGNSTMVGYLLKNGAEVNISDWFHRQTALMHAAQNGHHNVVEQLLANGADIDAADDTRQTALTMAARNGYTTVIKKLLLYNANLKEHSIDTALTMAAIGGHSEIVEILLQHGADPNRTRYFGYTSLRWAMRGGHEKIVDRLSKIGGTLDFPTVTAPAGEERCRPRYRGQNNNDSKLDPPDFIQRHFSTEIAAGLLHRGMIRRADPELYDDLRKWERSHRLPFEIPKVKEWNDKKIEELGPLTNSRLLSLLVNEDNPQKRRLLVRLYEVQKKRARTL